MNANGSWNSSANWIPNTGFPNAIDDAATFGSIITANRTMTLGQNITVGTLNLDDNNNYTISGANSLTFDVSAGNAALNVTVLNGNGAHTISSAVVLNDPLIISQDSTGIFTLSGIVSGGQGISKNGTGAFVLSGANTFGGGLTLNAGTFSIGNDAAAGTGTLSLNGGTIQSSSAAARALSNPVNLANDVTVAGTGALTFQTGAWTVSGGNRMLTVNNTAATTISSVIGEDVAGRSLTKAGTGNLVLSGANTFSGGLTLSAGTLSVGNDAAAGTGPLSLNGGTLQANGATAARGE